MSNQLYLSFDSCLLLSQFYFAFIYNSKLFRNPMINFAKNFIKVIYLITNFEYDGYYPHNQAMGNFANV